MSLQITIKGRHIEVTDALKDYTSKRVQKISRYFDHAISAEVILATERNWHIAEIHVISQGSDMRGRERSNDMYSSIDRVIDKLERQIKRQKGKVTNRRPGRGAGGGEDSSLEVEEKPRERDEDKHEKYAPRLEHVKRFLAEPMTIEEAIKEMEASGFDFYCFLNSENGRVNVVYKRERGFGLIDPRLEEAGVV